MKSLFAIVIFIFGPVAFGQADALLADKNLDINTNESVFVHLNATTFVSGETLLYKIYCIDPLDNSPSTVSKVAYAELTSKDGIVVRQKLFLDGGNGNGDIFIGPSIASGSYKLVAYTNWMLNKNDKQYFEADIIVINPFRAAPSELVTATASSETRPNVADQTSADPQNLKSFGTRQLVTLPFGAEKLPSGNYSVSVRKHEDLPTVAALSATGFVSNDRGAVTSHLHLPDLRGELISGNITSKTGTSVGNKIVAASVTGKSFLFKTGKTNDTGKFYISIEKSYPASDVYLQVVDQNPDDYTITIDGAPEHHFPLAFDSAFKLDPAMKSAIEQRSVASQIENAYSAKKTDSLTVKEYSAFYEPIAKEYVLDDYTRFPTFKETVIEVLEEAYFTQENGKHQLHLRDFSTQVKSNDPVLVMADGLLLQNVEELFAYRMADVSKVAIVTGAYRVGAKNYSGIINVITKNHNFTSKLDYLVKAPLSRPEQHKIYFAPDYSNAAKDDRIPDYRLQLLWKSVLPNEPEPKIAFYTSDVTGLYDVVIEGFTNENKPISMRENFIVK